MDIIELKKEITKNIKEKSEISIITTSVLRGVLATAQNAAIEVKTNVTEEIINSALLKEQETIKEMIETCPVERIDLRQEYNARLNVINYYVSKIIENPEKTKETLNKVELKGTQKKRKAISKSKGKVNMKIISQIISKIFKKMTRKRCFNMYLDGDYCIIDVCHNKFGSIGKVIETNGQYTLIDRDTDTPIKVRYDQIGRLA
mgnify:CR=1 FL=1|nr:MAG TPA: hypothetical protein [Caudoviricetes sp.]